MKFSTSQVIAVLAFLSSTIAAPAPNPIVIGSWTGETHVAVNKRAAAPAPMTTFGNWVGELHVSVNERAELDQ
ncbi:hypothetical protein P691DRAFT_809716 [Macrolepiota fuliginosa MF-IS2]|uniref:Uncharacterized protein n=1 Tax=Macrolepiota fuliginosa MF-IS2 TaxID=1400762 RepID=A0A9P5XHX3_9AGAR|nr:hypothetical protein P691DRAFT_809716 [Macrolepiota fuliginosa MF-IS2]